MRYERNFEIDESCTWGVDAESHPSWAKAIHHSAALSFGILFWQSVISVIAWMIFAR